MRGATAVLDGDIGGVDISIHAPREGSDLLSLFKFPNVWISIHAPREGSDSSDAAMTAISELISIHAPREGSDKYNLVNAKR